MSKSKRARSLQSAQCDECTAHTELNKCSDIVSPPHRQKRSRAQKLCPDRRVTLTIGSRVSVAALPCKTRLQKSSRRHSRHNHDDPEFVRADGQKQIFPPASCELSASPESLRRSLRLQEPVETSCPVR